MNQLPPQVHHLSSGFFEDQPGPDDLQCFEQLYTLWNQTSTLDEELFKRVDITVPLSGHVITDNDDTTTFSAHFLRVSKSSIDPPYTMLVRGEYEFVAGLLEEKSVKQIGNLKGCLLLGHPRNRSESKTQFGTYFLIRRLLKGHNTYVRTSTGFYCFTTEGFEHCVTEDVFTKYLVTSGLSKMRAILLYDTNQGGVVPQPVLYEYWVVVITSPATHHYKELRKQIGTTTIWMEPWSWEEVYVTGQVMYSRGHETLWEIYDSMGPSIRPASKVSSGLLEDVKIEFKKSVDVGLSKMKNNGTTLLKRALEAVRAGKTDSFPSAIFILKPVDQIRRKYTLDTVTRAMADRVLLALEEAAASEQESFDDLFSSTWTAPACGNLFEVRFLQFLRKKLAHMHLDYSPRFLPPRTSPNAVPDDPNFRITITQKTTIYDVDDVLNFMLPGSPFDFLAHVSDNVLVCQASTYSDQSVIIAGLDDVKAITANGSLADHRFWKIVFIVPTAVAPSWKSAMPVTKGKARKYQHRSTEEYEDIEQYILGIDFV
ncbi:hypothetical protein GGX14DRAFT_425847 [Mycena pura]|uniref:Uncharacterized protein n=1 Tax=Mycena pura TaxID=153505 RepID=A0AAD6YNH1_9AGAR|nr:hypothetical protein GGX14DRAFT_425847 [Mycena pura]